MQKTSAPLTSKLKVLSVVFLSFLIFNFSLLTAPVASAHCPLCVAGAVVGVTLTRWIGIDDSITGVWIAALLGAMSFWFYSWLVGKKIEKMNLPRPHGRGFFSQASSGAESLRSETLRSNPRAYALDVSRSGINKYKSILKPLIYILVWGTTLWSFYKFQLIIRMTQIFGLDKLTFGMLTGGILFYLIDIGDNFLIRKAGKVYFPYQRVIMSLGSMVILSLVIYILINFFI